MTCEICPSTDTLRRTDVGLTCCRECQRIFGFIPVEIVFVCETEPDETNE